MAALSPAHREGCARLGIARLAAFRLDVYEATILGTYDGQALAGHPTGLRIDGASITHVLNEQPDTASFRMSSGLAPIAGKTITVHVGDASATHQVFGGRVLETTTLYESAARNVAYDMRCLDPTWLMNRRRVLATYVNASATDIVTDLMLRFTRGVGLAYVQPGLPLLDVLTFTNELVPQCLTTICERIGASWYVDYQSQLHVFTNEPETAYDITDASPRTSRHHTLTDDLSQVVTRIIGRGGGVSAAIDQPAGSVELLVEEGDEPQSWYAPAGGTVEVNTQIITYSGVRGLGATGALVGASNAPAAPALWRAANGALGIGTYQYGATFVTAAGESGIGPLASLAVTHAGYTAPVTPTRTQRTQGSSGMVPGGTYQFLWSFVYIGGGRANSPALTQVVNGFWWDVYVGTPAGTSNPLTHHFPELAPSQGPLEQIEIYRTTNGGTTFYQDTQWTRAQFAALGAGSWLISSNISDATLPSKAPLLPNVGIFNAVWLSDIPVSPSSEVTQRNLYRTTANGAQPQLLTTLANNSATVFFDDRADGTLGAIPPATDTSGLTDNRQVQPGATELPVSSTAAFSADGGGAGWVRVGSVIVRYSGIGAGVLTGLPATGLGALTAPVRYGTQVLVQPRLVGIPASGTGAMAQPIRKGDTVTIRIVVDDLAAQEAFAARIGGTPEDGVVEEVVSDARFNLVELTAQCLAHLTDRKDPHRTLRFESRDDSLQVGRLITINISTPPISGTFRIQRIGFSEIAIAGGRATVRPLRTVEATTKLFTLTNLLRQLRGREGGVP